MMSPDLMTRGIVARLHTVLALLIVSVVLLPAVQHARDAEAQPFTFTVVDTDLTPLEYGAMAFADLDHDGDLDLVGGGNSSRREPFVPTAYVALSGAETQVFGGNWQRTFAETPLPTQLWHSDVTWIDYDRDGDLDFVITGTSRSGAAFENLPFEGLTHLYRNDGNGAFDAVDAGLTGVYSSTIARGDYDNDGDDDLLIAGLTDADTPVTQLYRNDDGAFAREDSPFRQLAFGDAQWGDYDNDGDKDLALSGAEADGAFVTLLYRNDGDAGFTEIDAGLPGLAFSDLDWGDLDNDGDLDLALTGATLSLPNFLDGFAEIYRNDGGSFTPLDANLRGILYGTTAWGDYDNDGDNDLLLLGGVDVTSGRTGRVYRNEGGVFLPRLALVGVVASSVAWGDYDGDNDLDVLATGANVNFNPLTRLYRNDQISVNTLPTVPEGLQATVQGNSVTLSWGSATDDQTPAAGLTYSLRVGTASGASNVVAPLADAASGQRWTPGRGNVEHNMQWTLRGLGLGTYYWSVQAVDQSFKGSPFAAEGTFTITTNADVGTGTDDEAGLPTQYALHASFPNPFREAATIPYDLPEPTPVTLTIYNILGAEVTRLVQRTQAAGLYEVVWNGLDDAGRRVGAGVYFVRMRAGRAHWTRQLVVLR